MAGAMIIGQNALAQETQWGTVGNEMCHYVSSDLTRTAHFACPKNLPIKVFACRGATKDEADIADLNYFIRPNVSAFTLIADPTNARLIFNNTVVSTTDVDVTTDANITTDVNTTETEWTGVSVTRPWNGHYDIRDDPIELMQHGNNYWTFWTPASGPHSNIYTCFINPHPAMLLKAIPH